MSNNLETYFCGLDSRDFVVVFLGDIMIAKGYAIDVLKVLSCEILSREVLSYYTDKLCDFYKVTV